jgi:tRNA (guanine-N7-)-methyltransferase
VHTPGVGSLCKLVAEQGLHNLRIIQHDAVEVLRDMIAPASLAGVHIFFPDPWPKKRHHKRRLLQPALCGAAGQPPAAGWLPALRHRLARLRTADAGRACGGSLLQNTAPDYAPRPDYRPLTKFEQRGLRLGHGVWDLVFRGGRSHSSRKTTGRISSRECAQFTLAIA